MKKKNSILFLSTVLVAASPLLSSFSAPVLKENKEAAAQETSMTPSSLLSSLRQGFSVSGTATETLNYPEGYTQYNSVTTTSFSRDYGQLADDDGVSHQAIRIYEGSQTSVYFEGDDYTAYEEVLLSDNTIGTIKYQSFGMDVLYVNEFKNPFNYVSVSDIDSEFHLDSEKASFVLSTITGIRWSVDSAQFVFENGALSSLDFAFAVKPMGIQDSTGAFVTIDAQMSVDFSLSLDVPQFRHLQPSTTENPELETAIEALSTNNYTVTFRSNGLSVDSRLYVTANDIYYQANASQVGPQNGDVLYHKNGAFYDIYNIKNGLPDTTNVSSSFSSPLETYLGGLKTISAALFQKKSDNLYTLQNDAIVYGAPSLVPSTYGMSEDSGIQGYISLENGKIADVTSILFSGSNVTFITHFENYGSTSLPAWIDVESL